MSNWRKVPEHKVHVPNYVNIFLGECMENMGTLSLGPFQRDLHCDAASEVKLILILSNFL